MSDPIAAQPEGSDVVIPPDAVAPSSDEPISENPLETSDEQLDTSEGGPVANEDEPAAHPSEGGGDPAAVTDTSTAAPSGSVRQEGTLAVGDIDEAHTITGTNPTDGAPTVIDPGYVTVPDAVTTSERNKLERELAADESATEAERSTGERTVSGADPADRIDAAMVSTSTGVEYRAKNTIRAVLMERPFSTSDGDGESGEYLAEDADGNKFKLTGEELKSGWVAL